MKPDTPDQLARLAELLRTLTDQGIDLHRSRWAPDLEVQATAGVAGAAAGAELPPSALEALLDADLREALRELELPHVVVCFDRVTGHLSIEGPYDDGLTASRLAEHDAWRDRDNSPGFSYLVVPLLPARRVAVEG